MMNLYPYKSQILQSLTEEDFEKRLVYCNWFLEFIRLGMFVLDRVFFTDEAYFEISGYQNKQNNRSWSKKIRTISQLRRCIRKKLEFGARFQRRKSWSHFFLSSNVNSEAYQEIIKQFIKMLEVPDRYCYLQQDGVPCHTSSTAMDFLKKFFDNIIISKGQWPPRSPNLTSPDFFLWGYLKSRVYLNNPLTINDLKIA